jgi:small subunit ribosomal protein S17
LKQFSRRSGEKPRNNMKEYTGIVVSTKMDKTAVVRIERKFRHKMYRKVITKHKKFHAHCEDKSIKEGDTVVIKETKPMSKLKHFIVVKKVDIHGK